MADATVYIHTTQSAATHLSRTNQYHLDVPQERPHSGTQRPGAVLPSWEFLSSVRQISKTGSESEVDELVEDQDDDRPLKRQKTLLGSRSCANNASRTAAKNCHADSQDFSGLSAQVGRPESNDGATELQDASNASFSHAEMSLASPLSFEKVVPNIRKGPERPSTSSFGISKIPDSTSLPALVHPLTRTSSHRPRDARKAFSRQSGSRGSLSLSTLDSSHPLLAKALNFRQARRQLHRHAKAIYDDSQKPANDYRATETEIETWADATVASIVYRKPSLYSKKAEADARRMNGLKLMKVIEGLAVSSSSDQTANPSNSAPTTEPIAVPRVSLSSRSAAVVKSLFGDEDPSLQSIAIASKPSSRSMRSVSMSRDSSTGVQVPDVLESSVPTDEYPSGTTTPSYVRMATSPPPLLPLEQSLTAESPVPVFVEPEDVVASTFGDPVLLLDISTEKNNDETFCPPTHLQSPRSPSSAFITVNSTSSRSERRSPVDSRTTPGLPIPVALNQAEPATTPSIEEPCPSQHERAIQQARNIIPASIPPQSEETIELISPMLSEERSQGRRFSSLGHGLATPPPSDAPPIGNEPIGLQGGQPEGCFDPVVDDMHNDLSECETSAASPFDLSGLFSPTMESTPLPEILSPLPTPQTDSNFYDLNSYTERDHHASTVDSSYMYELSEAASQLPALPTVFEPEYRKNRFQDRWVQNRHGCELDELLAMQSVIAEVQPALQLPREDDDYLFGGWVGFDDVDSDEEEIDELANDSDQNTVTTTPTLSRKPKRRATRRRSLHDQGIVHHRSEKLARQSLTGYFKSLDFNLLEDSSAPQDWLIDPPLGLATQVARWTRALQSLLKGKQKLGEKDMLDLKDILEDVHASHAHIQPSSSLAKAVSAIADMGQEDIPNKDELGLRFLATKSVQAWGIMMNRDRDE